MATIPDKDEHKRRFAALELADRREIIKAVNRGDKVDRRKLSPLAVGVARRQMRFWKYAWLVAPVVALTQLYFVPLEVVLMTAVVSTLTLGAMSLFFYRRAARAEQRNLELAAGPSASGRRHSGQATAFGRHLPGKAGATDRARPRADRDVADEDAEPAADGSPIPPDRKPYKPRRRKRR